MHKVKTMPMWECNRLNTITVFHRIWSWDGNEIVFRIHEKIDLGVQFDQDRLVAWFHDQCVDKSCNSWSKGVDVCMARKTIDIITFYSALSLQSALSYV